MGCFSFWRFQYISTIATCLELWGDLLYYYLPIIAVCCVSRFGAIVLIGYLCIFSSYVTTFIAFKILQLAIMAIIALCCIFLCL